jgi:cytochrome d ubiquinol oxidase subunit I
MEAVDVHRLQFGFTAGFHYLFPQFTMGLALVILVLKTMALRGDEEANRAARFWTKIFGLSFALGVVTGIPMEFQFGTNWASFSRASGGSSDRRWPWKACSHSFWRRRFCISCSMGKSA